MDQQKIGGFIAALRKEKEWTQAQLGERLGVTNKTVSRWERGHYLPDISLMPALCEELGISLNELLSGERLNDDSFREAADQQLAASLNREQHLRRRPTILGFLEGGGTGLLLSAAINPHSGRSVLVIGLSILMIALGWYLHSRWEKDLLAFAEDADKDT